MKLGKAERTEIAAKAVARRQEFPMYKLLLVMVSFSAACGLVYMYLNYVLSNDDDDE